MLNILSTTEKKKTLIEYRLRLTVVAVFAIGSLVLSSLILLAPSYMLAVSKYSEAKNTLVILEENESRSGKEKDVNTQIVAINKKIDLFLKNNSVSTLVPSATISNILNIKGDAIKIEGFTYDASDAQERIVITGVAQSRDKLSQFVESLKKDPTFTSVELPISSYVKSLNIDFSVVMTKKTKK